MSSDTRQKGLQFRLIVFNVEKGANIGMLLRSAYAFGCEEVLTIGKSKIRVTGAQGTQQVMKRRHFYRLEEAIEACRAEDCQIVGLEVGGSWIHEYEFAKKTAFILGNEGRGLEYARQFCDAVVAIPQWGGVPSLNVAVAGSLAMYEFQKRQNFPVAEINGEKFTDEFFKP